MALNICVSLSISCLISDCNKNPICSAYLYVMLKFYQIHFHFKDKKKNSASTSKNNEEEISKGRFFSISVCRFLQISGPTNSLRATGLNAGLTNF